MKIKVLAMALMVMASATTQAQSSYEVIGDTETTQNASGLDNLQVNRYYQQWLGEYEEVGSAINDISEQYQREVDKRGYPKKKTVKRKIELVSQYIQLLQTEMTDPQLNQNLDKGKVQRKIDLWQEQLDGLQELLKKI